MIKIQGLALTFVTAGVTRPINNGQKGLDSGIILGPTVGQESLERSCKFGMSGVSSIIAISAYFFVLHKNLKVWLWFK